MSLPALHTALDLENNLTDELYQKLVSQIEKDFIFTGITYNFDDLTPPQLLICLHEVVEHLISKEYATFLNLLYRIDIPEHKVEPTNEFTLEENVVLLILKRQWLKIQLRMKYSAL